MTGEHQKGLKVAPLAVISGPVITITSENMKRCQLSNSIVNTQRGATFEMLQCRESSFFCSQHPPAARPLTLKRESQMQLMKRPAVVATGSEAATGGTTMMAMSIAILAGKVYSRDPQTL